MPLFLEPNQRFPIVLDSDMSKPTDQRPTFYARSLNMRMQEELANGIDAAVDHSTVREIYDANCALLTTQLVGWSNMGKAVFGETAVQDFLSFQEVRELLRKMLSHNHVSIEEKKS